MDDVTSVIVNVLLWSYIPNFVTRFLLETLYYNFVYAGASRDPKRPQRPQQGTARYRRDFIRVYTIVILFYLAYCLINAYQSLPASYYDRLGVERRVLAQGGTGLDRAIKSRWRQVALQLHPDKNPSPEAADMFRSYQHMYEVLNKPLLRTVYERFGHLETPCRECVTYRDHIHNALSNFYGFYLGFGIVLILLNVVGGGQVGRYWRFVSFVAMGAYEWSLLLQDPQAQYNVTPWEWTLLGRFLEYLWPSSLLISERISLMHSAYIYGFMALTLLAPVYNTNASRSESTRNELVIAVRRLAVHVSQEVNRSYAEDFVAFHDAPDQRAVLTREMKLIALEQKLFETEPELRSKYMAILHEQAVEEKKAI